MPIVAAAINKTGVLNTPVLPKASNVAVTVQLAPAIE